MRPKRVILIIEPDADELGCLMFSILLNGFKAVGAQTIPQANEIRKTTHVDAILTRTKIVEHAPVPVVVKGNRSMADTVELLKCAVVRKPGPKRERKEWTRILQTCRIGRMEVKHANPRPLRQVPDPQARR